MKHSWALLAPVCLLGASPAAAQDVSYDLSCQFRLDMQRTPPTLSAPSPVTISFSRSGDQTSNIRVIDPGGILWPFSNLKITESDGVITMGAADAPKERPGTWTARRHKIGRMNGHLFELKESGRKLADIWIPTELNKKGGILVGTWSALGILPALAGASGNENTRVAKGAAFCNPAVARQQDG